MDPKLKIALAVVAGVVGGMLLLGTALAVPAAFHMLARPSVAADEFGPGMMGPRGQWDDGYGQGYGPQGRGMMGPRSGMMGRGYAPDGGCSGQGYGPQGDGTSVCPHAEDTTATAL